MEPFSDLYIPNSIGFGSVSYVSSDPSYKSRRPMGFVVRTEKELEDACTSDYPCGWCASCVIGEDT